MEAHETVTSPPLPVSTYSHEAGKEVGVAEPPAATPSRLPRSRRGWKLMLKRWRKQLKQAAPSAAVGFLGSPLTLLAAALGVYAVIAQFVHTNVRWPYMDEIFHIPQAQQFCERKYQSWDQKITTLPGMYIISAAGAEVARLGAWVLRRSTKAAVAAACSTPALRSLNIVLSSLVLWLARDISTILHPGLSAWEHNLKAAAVGLYPVHFFFAFLYYTEAASLAATLATLRYALAGAPRAAAAAGAAAILARQTNAAWVAFSLALWALHALHLPPKLARLPLHERIVGAAHSARLRIGPLLPQLAPGAALFAFFALFLAWNGAIAVGDRKAHKPVAHLAQLAYGAAVLAAALAPATASPVRVLAAISALRRLTVGKALRLVGVVGCLGLAVRYGTIAHPYLVADNRHYTFYVWRKLINPRKWARYALVPAYTYAAWAVDAVPRAATPTLVPCGFVVATALVTVPAGLFEFRYFNTPVAIALLFAQLTRTQLLLTIALYAVVNAATLHMFLARPFRGRDESVARFMW